MESSFIWQNPTRKQLADPSQRQLLIGQKLSNLGVTLGRKN